MEPRVRGSSRPARPCARLVAIAVLVVSCLLALDARAGGARRPVYTVAIGENAVAESLKPNASGVGTLRYADDDALRFYSLMQGSSRRAYLLSVLDADTQRRFPDFARRALAPTLAELERVVESILASMIADRARGEQPELLFFYSGHGVRDEAGNASLSLKDAALTRQWLYDRLLARLPAQFVHLVVDACHAAAVVRPRDANATLEELGESERQRYVDEATLARFPNVGAVLASSAGTQSFEWDAYRSGVFAHQLISGLRGGADVNRDLRIEYSEIAAFLSAANLRVSDPRARLEVVVRPPPLDRRAPLVELASPGRDVMLEGRAEGRWAQAFFVENADGERLLDVFPEPGARILLRVPAGERLYIVRKDAEIELPPREGGKLALASLHGRPPKTRARGSIDSALRTGLFAAPFGPAFYLGYVSQREELVPVSLAAEPEPARSPARDAPPKPRSRALAAVFLAGAGVAALATGVFTVVALNAKHDYQNTELERRADEASRRFYDASIAAWVSGGAGLLLGTAGVVVLAWPADKAGSARIDPKGLVLGARGEF